MVSKLPVTSIKVAQLHITCVECALCLSLLLSLLQSTAVKEQLAALTRMQHEGMRCWGWGIQDHDVLTLHTTCMV